MTLSFANHLLVVVNCRVRSIPPFTYVIPFVLQNVLTRLMIFFDISNTLFGKIFEKVLNYNNQSIISHLNSLIILKNFTF